MPWAQFFYSTLRLKLRPNTWPAELSTCQTLSHLSIPHLPNADSQVQEQAITINCQEAHWHMSCLIFQSFSGEMYVQNQSHAHAHARTAKSQKKEK